MNINQLQSKISPYYQPFGTSTDNVQYTITVKQQPQKARMCSFKDKVDRRPIDPPPVIEIHQSNTLSFNDYQNSANFFVHATLVDSINHSDLNYVNGNSTISGPVVQSLHKLKDTNNTESAFFIFADLSIRIEGVFKLKFTLFQIKGMHVETKSSVLSDPFRVYSPRHFPGMSESTELTRHFSDQGVRIRVRKEARSFSSPSMKRRRRDDYSSSGSSSPKEGETRLNAMSMENLLIPPEPPTLPEQTSFPNRTLFPLPTPLENTMTYPRSENYYYTSVTPPPQSTSSTLFPNNCPQETFDLPPDARQSNEFYYRRNS